MALVDNTLQHVASDEGLGGGVGIFRTRRHLRVARVVRPFKVFHELWMLVSGVYTALVTLAWAFPDFGLVIYIFASLVTRSLDHGNPEDEELDRWFGTVLRSMFTLFQCLTTEGPESGTH